MKTLLIVLSLFSITITAAQEEDQSFCDGLDNASYFTLVNKKKLMWYNTWYIEEYTGDKNINGEVYRIYKQTWEDGDTDLLYMREADGKLLQYDEKCKADFMRYDEFLEAGSSWDEPCKKVKYTVLSFTDELTTPFCKYKNLMSLKAEYEKVTYIFYYQKGYGYVGATKNGKIISCATPVW